MFSVYAHSILYIVLGTFWRKDTNSFLGFYGFSGFLNVKGEVVVLYLRGVSV